MICDMWCGVVLRAGYTCV